MAVSACQTVDSGSLVLRRDTPFHLYTNFAWHPTRPVTQIGDANAMFSRDLVQTLEATVSAGLLAKGFKETRVEESHFLVALILDSRERSDITGVKQRTDLGSAKGVKAVYRVTSMTLRILDSNRRVPVWEGYSKIESFGHFAPDQQELIGLSLREIADNFPPN